ncbi:MAG: HD domain-containing phosphohydrolase [Burkholderiales bacterium]
MSSRAQPLEVAVADLRPGLYIQLELSWIDHPFPSSRFLIKNAEQIATLRGLGLTRVKVLADRSDAQALATLTPLAEAAAPMPAFEAPADPTVSQGTPAHLPPAEAAKQRHRELLQAQQASLLRSQKLHGKAVQSWSAAMQAAAQQPAVAAEIAGDLSAQLVSELHDGADTTVRVLSEAAGTGSVQHAINVTVLSLMLAQRLALPDTELQEVALGALLHDIGKQMLPENLRSMADNGGALALRAEREHIALGLRQGMAMRLPAKALRVIGQHHELMDGSGLPQGLAGDEICMAARVVAVADRYDRLCNPRQGGTGRTPHEAQALLYAQMRHQLDPQVLTAFIKLIGVYPPGSVVQLSDSRYALVVATHPQQPLKPTVLVHDAGIPRDEALLVDLLRAPNLGIRRSLHPQHLPRATLDYLSPGPRVHYYFAHELAAAPLEACA